jgi:hypothetical protein
MILIIIILFFLRERKRLMWLDERFKRKQSRKIAFSSKGSLSEGKCKGGGLTKTSTLL